MKMRRLPLLGLMMMFACADTSSDVEDQTGGVGGKADETEAGGMLEFGNCVVRNSSGLTVDPDGLADPIAELVLRADGECRQTMTEVFELLEEVDTDDCDGARTALVNEYAQLIGEGTSEEARAARSQFRAVTLRGCNGRQMHELAFSTGGRPVTRVSDVRQNLDNFENDLPIDVQIIAFDPEDGKETNGVFNYYNILGGEWNYFGNSRDFTLLGAGDESTDGTPRDRDCALCHTSGDLIMKELDSPWLHWEGQLDGGTPGAEKLFENRPLLGQRIGGKGLEDAVGGEKVAGVREGGFNNHWNPLRVEQMANYDCSEQCDNDSCEEECNENATFALLEPLFCSVQANLVNSPGVFPERLVVHPAWAPEGEDSAFGSFPRPVINTDEANAYILDNNQRISSQIAGRFPTRVTGSDMLRDDDGVISDTRFPTVHPVVAEIDVNYVEELVRQGIISEDFKHDVLFVDYSRPLFSSQRCELLEKFVPALPAGKRTKIIIKREFIENMGSASGLSGFEKEFRESLDDSSDEDNHRAEVREFLQACSVRAGLDTETFAVDEDASREFTRDVMTLISATRARGREEMLLLRQFPAAMPIDDAEDLLADNLARIHLSTAPSSLCELNGLPSDFEP